MKKYSIQLLTTVGIAVLSGIVGYSLHDRIHPRPTIDVQAPEVQNVIMKCAKGRGSFVINVSDGWVKLNNCPVLDAAKGFWEAVNSMAGKTCGPIMDLPTPVKVGPNGYSGETK